ncbi:hypothetical protein SASPL_156034 [Salvia splendens]|uniref:non-specific serine/threonine protein kinase n=1 Tax=Salvia splendens TaxID=180675 RepID=A0A8X8VXE3_SALSN|nr:hypothetical protein SASPL_156034 [Salvia splendens]
MSQPKIKRRIGKYEVGRTIGEGAFAKVKFARNSETGDAVALKILDKDAVLKHKMAEQIKREIATMKLIKHPNVVSIYEVMASKTKIFIVLEFVTGGELFDKILESVLAVTVCRLCGLNLRYVPVKVNHGRMREEEAKPENLLLDAAGNLKVSDFGLSALSQQVRIDGLLHTTCGHQTMLLLRSLMIEICLAEFTCPLDFLGAMKLITRILEPNPEKRITIPDILEDEWFKKDYKSPSFDEKEDANLDDVEAVFKDSEEYHVTEKREVKPAAMNALKLISMSKGLDLGNLFDEQGFKRETRFTSKSSAKDIYSKIEEAAKPLVLMSRRRITRFFQVTPSLHMVEVRKAKGDTLEFHKFYKNLSTCLEDVYGIRRRRPTQKVAVFSDRKPQH